MDDPLILSETAEDGDNSVLEDLYKTLPTNVRLYGEFMAGKDNLITEEDFSQEELELIKSLIQEQQKENEGLENYIRSFAEQGSPLKKRTRFVYADPTSDKPDLVEEEYYTNYKGQEFHPDEVDNELLKKETERLKKAIDSFDTTRNKTSIKSYYDREVASPGFLSTLKKLGDPRYNVQTSLGEFTAVEEEDGSIRIDDTYNFNPEEFSREDIDADLLIQNLTNPQNLMELLARKFKNDSSRDIQIKISPKEMDRGGLMADTDNIENIGNMLDNARTKFMRNLERADMLTNMQDLPKEKAEKLFDESRKLYQEDIRSIARSDPDTFKLWQDSQQKRYVDTLNKLAFESNPDIPFDEELGDELQYLLTMPYGSEAEKGLDLNEVTSGFATPRFENQKEVMVSMGADDPETVARHEGLHELTNSADFSTTKDSGKETVYETEYVARAFDYLRGLLEGNEDLATRTEKYVVRGSDGEDGGYTLLKLAIESIPQLYEKGYFDRNKATLDTAQKVVNQLDKDDQGFIDSILGKEPEKVKDPSVSTKDPLYMLKALKEGDEDTIKDLKELISVLPFSEKEQDPVHNKDYYTIKDRSSIDMSSGGLMAADGVLIDEIIASLPEEDPFESKQDPSYERPPVLPVPDDFDPESILGHIFPEDIEKYEEQFPEQEALSDSQYSSEEINTMDKELDQAFSDFENSRGSAADRDAYRNRVREIYTSNPDLFRSHFQDKNTDQLIEMYNELDFSDEEVPFDDEIAETAKYRATVPFGSEDDTNLGGGDIFNLSIGRKGTVAGKSRRYDDGVSEVFTPGGADKDLRDNILRHEGLHSLTEHESVRELLTVYPNELLVRAYDVLRGIASGDREWAEQALKFIEKAYRGKYGKSDIKLILSKLMPLLKEKAAEMSEGGLMADPLMLSETVEEEAEPKMGVGDYIEGAKELITDFSPAGTAQAMIDAAEEAYKLASGAEDASFKDFGIAAIGAIPGGKTATKVVDNASKIADEIAEASLEISKLDNYVPKKTVTAYKLFTKGEDGNLYPLFVDANKPLPVGEWIKANMPDYIFQAKNGRYYVPSKATAPKTESGKKAFYDTGERKATGSSVEIPDDPKLRKKLVEAGFIAKEGTKSVKAVAARPGWHAGDVPIAHHIGAMIDPATGGTKKLEMPNVRRDDQVWAEVELPADVDWQQEALRRANVKKDGNIDVGTAHITDRVPHGGSYRYKTNPNMTGEWLIGGELKINRVLDDAEVKSINDAAGVEDLPRYSDFMDQYASKTEMNAGGLMSDEYNRAES